LSGSRVALTDRFGAPGKTAAGRGRRYRRSETAWRKVRKPLRLLRFRHIPHHSFL